MFLPLPHIWLPFSIRCFQTLKITASLLPRMFAFLHIFLASQSILFHQSLFFPASNPPPLPSHPSPLLEYDWLKHFNTLQGIQKIIFLNECTNIFPPHYISCYNRQILIWHYKQNFSLSNKECFRLWSNTCGKRSHFQFHPQMSLDLNWFCFT